MFELITRLFDISLFKKGPQDLPASIGLLYLLTVSNIIVSLLMTRLHAQGLDALLQAIIGAALLIGFSGLALLITGKQKRFYQTTSALLGIDTLISFLALPAIATIMIGNGSLLAFIVTLGLMGWHWAVIGHIMRNALEQSLIFSLGLALLYLLGSYQVIALLFPEITGIK